MDRRVTDPAGIRLLLDPEMRRILAALTDSERRLSDVAVELGVPLNSLLYRVRSLVRAELVQITRQTRRAGRPVKWYRAVARSFFIPFNDGPADVPEAFSRADEDRRHAQYIWSMSRAGLAYLDAWGLHDWGLRFDLDRQGNLVLQHAVDEDSAPDVLDPRSPAFLNIWLEDLALDFEQAKELQRELAGIYRRYRQGQGAQRYLLRLSLAPVAQQEGGTPV